MQKTAYKQPMHFRIDAKIADQLREASEKTKENPYPPTMTALLERGVKLALDELKTKKR